MRPSCPFHHASALLLIAISATSAASTHGLEDARYHDARPRRTSPPEVFNFGKASAPSPTPAPNVRYRNANLAARSKGSDTCGFWSSWGASTWDPLICRWTGETCSTVGTAFGCRSQPYTTCIDKGSATSLVSMCRDNLQGDRELCCVESDAIYGPKCFVFVQKDGEYATVTNHRCWQTDFSQWNGMYLDTTTGKPGESATSVGLTSISPVSSLHVFTPVRSSTAATSTASSAKATQSSGSPVGAIVGGAVGGFAVLATAVCVIVWLVIRGRRQQKVEDTTPESPGADQYLVQPSMTSPTTPRYLSGYYQPEKYQPVSMADPSPSYDIQSPPPTVTQSSKAGDPAELA